MACRDRGGGRITQTSASELGRDCRWRPTSGSAVRRPINRATRADLRAHGLKPPRRDAMLSRLDQRLVRRACPTVAHDCEEGIGPI